MAAPKKSCFMLMWGENGRSVGLIFYSEANKCLLFKPFSAKDDRPVKGKGQRQ